MHCSSRGFKGMAPNNADFSGQTRHCPRKKIKVCRSFETIIDQHSAPGSISSVSCSKQQDVQKYATKRTSRQHNVKPCSERFSGTLRSVKMLFLRLLCLLTIIELTITFSKIQNEEKYVGVPFMFGNIQVSQLQSKSQIACSFR